MVFGAAEANASAALLHPFLSQLTGTAAANFSHPVCGVAVDPANQNVYVADAGDRAVDIFDSSGAFQSQITGLATEAGSFNTPCSIAVSASTGQTYVADSGPDLVYVFDSTGTLLTTITGANTPSGSLGHGFLHVAIDQATGAVYVAESSDGVVDIFTATGEYLSRLEGLTEPWALAVDGQGDVYVGPRSEAGVQEFNSTGELVTTISGAGTPQGQFTQVLGAAVDEAGSLFIVDGGANVVDEFTAAGVYRSQIASTPAATLAGPEGVAVNSAGHVYVANPGPPGDVDVFGPAVVVPDVTTEPASGVTASTATLHGSVNPDGAGTATCTFEYGTTVDYAHARPCSHEIASGSQPVPVSSELSELSPDTAYHYRLRAHNANGDDFGGDVEFKTAGPGIHSESVSDITTTSAVVEAAIDPNGAATQYFVEYGADASYGARAPATGTVAIGSAPGDRAVRLTVAGLQPATLYHYRVVALNEFAQSDGTDEQFRTQRAGGTTSLPDHRQWEMVTPTVKHNVDIEGLAEGGGLIQAAASGEALAYIATGPLGSGAGSNPSPAYSEIVAHRGPTAWESQDIATEHQGTAGTPVGNFSEYKWFSPDVSIGLVEPLDGTPLAPTASELTPYLRHADGTYEPLVDAQHVPPGTHFGGAVEFVDATADLSHVILSSSVPLTATPIANAVSLYERSSDASLHLISVLPNGEPAPTPVLGDNHANVRNAVAADGSRAVWESEGHLFLRDTRRDETIQLDAPEPGAGAGGTGARFDFASEDGSRVLFRDAVKLTVPATPEGRSDLYEFKVTSGPGERLAGTLTDRSTALNPGEPASVQGLLPGASSDGSYLYVVANGVLAPGGTPGDCVERISETPPPGAHCNLYLVHGASVTFIASLSNEDGPDWEDDAGNLDRVTGRASPNGRYFAFMSSRSLTGYDNRDAESGQPDEEVYLYDAATKALICASCNPTGARPRGVLDAQGFPGLLVDRPGTWTGHWLAASVPGWTSIRLAQALYQSRYLSNQGRLFFTAADALVPEDINRVEDVYQYEPVHVGACSSEDATFISGVSGCLGLISSGTSAEESSFLDASENGGDVFILTSAQLAPTDEDQAYDIYDAHECTASSPCLQPGSAAHPPATCTSPDSCKGPIVESAGDPGSFPTMIPGAGSSAPAGADSAVARNRHAQHLLAAALRRCHHKRNRRARAKCEAHARKLYGSHATSHRARRR